MITQRLEEMVRTALESAARDGAIELDKDPAIRFERPKRREHGDFATNVALAIAKGPPRAVAEAIKERFPVSPLVESVEVAGPGFLNIRLAPAWLHDVVRQAADPQSGFGRSKDGAGIKVNVEYVSANPTGPINVVSGRHAAVGDCVSNLLEATGHDVTREFYINDSGRQIRLFGASIAARYLQHFGKEAEVPEDGYKGDYIADIAAAIATEDGDRYLNDPEIDEVMARRGLDLMIGRMRASLERFGTRYDVWFSERGLHEAGEIEVGIEALRKSGLVEERDGALWFLSSRFGDDKDRVVVRSDGNPTYLAADTAYLLDKFERGFDRLIYLWGADHHGTVARLLAVTEGLRFQRDQVEVKLLQVVTITTEDAVSLKGSKRAGIIFELDDLVDEVGADAARYTFLTRSIDAPLDFDIALAKEQAPENPVYYVQYAHARICSIIRKAQEEGFEPDPSSAKLERLEHPSEDQLMRKLATYEEVVPEAAAQRAPQKMTRYVEELASTFSAFYRDCRVVTHDVDLTQARLALCVAARNAIADGLALLQVGAPERM